MTTPRSSRAPLTVAIGISLIALSRLDGGLGETMDQAVARYGPVLKKEQSPHLRPGEATVQFEFYKNGFKIRLSLVNGKVAWIHYSKGPGTGEPIFDTELRTLLDANAEGSQWSGPRDMDKGSLAQYIRKKVAYDRADGLANAEYEEFGGSTGSYMGLIIITKAWREATSAASGL